MTTHRYCAWTRRLLITLAVCAHAPAFADGLDFQFQPREAFATHTISEETETDLLKPEKILPRFGDAGTVRYSVGIVGANNFNDISLILARVSLEMFVIDGVSVGVEGDFGYIGQSIGEDGIGGGISMRARWHFLRRDRWSVYGDIAAGFFQASVNIPNGSGQFKFYLQTGGGISFAIGNTQRILLGARWCHLSNARTLSSNPGMDAVEIYAMLSVGF